MLRPVSINTGFAAFRGAQSTNPVLSVSTARTRITKPPQDQSVIKGTKAVMTCGVTRDPSVTVR